MPSTIIKGFDYDPQSRELTVTLVTGRAYVYFEVPQEVYDNLSVAFSKGRFYNKHIRSCYEYRETTLAE